MEHSKRPSVDLGKVLLWTNWIEWASRKLSFDLPPKELLVFFVVQSLELAHSLNSIVDKRLPQKVVDGHIRGYLLDRVWSYHLLTKLVWEDVQACGSRVAQFDSKRVLRASRAAVARVMLQKKSLADGTAIRAMTRRTVLRSLKLSLRKVGA
jgi:hypothetical protein